ncbi:MAG: deoxyribodipyrimidine photo-lyase, partial [Candidatus Puniceispirillaceae bacterium]
MSVTIHWFRFDLRLSDNPALTAAARSGQVVPVYILEDQIGEAKGQTTSILQQTYAMGGASKLWLHYALSSLQSDLQDRLILRRGSA